MPLALDEAQIEYLIEFRHFKKNASVRAAAKSLVNFFRDVCPQLLPKKYIGRFTEVDASNTKDAIAYGEMKMAHGIDGVQYLKDEENADQDRILSDKDFKRIRIAKLKAAVKSTGYTHKLGSASQSEDEGDAPEGEGAWEKDSDQEGSAGSDDEEMGEEEMSELGIDDGSDSGEDEEAGYKEARKKAEKKYDEMHADDDLLDDYDEEMGEDEMFEEGEWEVLESYTDPDQSEQASDDDSDAPPKLVSADAKAPPASKKKK